MAKGIGPVALLGMLLVGGAAFVGWRLLARTGTSSSAIPEREQVGSSPEAAQSATKLETPTEELAPRAAPPAKELSRKTETEDPEARIVRMKARMLAWKESEQWEKKYAGFGIPELQKEHDRIRKWILEASSVELEARFAAGLGEIVETGPAWTSPHFNPYDVYWVRGGQGQPWTKCTLPEDEFPEVYKQKALDAWLTDQIHDRADTASR